MPEIDADLKKYITYLQSLPRFEAVLTLDRILWLLAQLGNPQEKLKGIHVGGTNGKGSTCAMLQAMLSEAGYSVGLYTSPHLVSYTERYRIRTGSGAYQLMPEEEFYTILARIKLILDTHQIELPEPPTWFEIVTAIAFVYFAEQNVDWLVVEVGMGGEFDATNVRDWEYKIITNVTLEHTAELGSTIELIAQAKAGIIHLPKEETTGSKTRLVTACTSPALKVVTERAERCNLPYWLVGREIHTEMISTDWSGMRLTYERIAANGQVLQIADCVQLLVGLYQTENAACALGMVDLMRENGDICITDEQMRSGLQATDWPGRFETIAPVIIRKAFPHLQAERVVIDGSHNADGMRTLVETIQYFREHGELEHIVAIFAAKSDKDVSKMLAVLNPCVADFIFTRIHADVSSHNPAELVVLAGRGLEAASPEQALRLAEQRCTDETTLIVCGSLYLVGEIKKLFGMKKQWTIDSMEYNQDARR